ncbi:Plancitoxin-1 [Trichinella patagoniensis]|uniref:Plancitoxin-1 n=1 Tax=Trichinella patagoniensis TaxID=990121 RepID=A0A0V0ZEK6_9BILA|nr:Plancitoxin-1 [Trichinella patagoniensis]
MRVNLLINHSIVIQCSALNVDMSFIFHKQHQNAKMQGELVMQTGVGGQNWANSPQPITRNNDHSFAKALEHVIAANAENKFISYNNHPPDVPKVRTKSNSKGNTDAAAWIVHTVPGFPKARTGYLFPPAEVQKGHLLICLTIKEDQIDTIAITLRIATPLIYYNDIPDAQMDSRPNLKKLANGESRLTPPISGRNIRLVTSPISVNGDQSTLENDVSQWLVTETGNKFCAVDKPYQKSQTMEPAMAVCIDDATISARFKEIAQNLVPTADLSAFFLVGNITPLGAVDSCKRAQENCTGVGRTGGALHDSPITSQLTQRLHRSLGYVITTVSKIRSISCNDRLFSQMYEQNDEEFNCLLMVVERKNLYCDGSKRCWSLDKFKINLQLQGIEHNQIRTRSVISQFASKLALLKCNFRRRENFTNFKALLHSGKVKKCTMMAFKSIVII